MDWPLSRRGFAQLSALGGAALGVHLAGTGEAQAGPFKRAGEDGWVVGHLTGAQAIAEALRAEGVGCVYGIPGAQENELWDEFKSRGVPYLLSAHEYGAACMADGYARVTGRPGVLCVVPGPGVTNALTGLGEALLDSSPVVALVGDVANGEKARPFQVHSLDTVALLKPVTKCVIAVTDVRQIPEPVPVPVVVPFHMLIEAADFRVPPPADVPPPWDDAAFEKAVQLLADPRQRVGIYAGAGCMSATAALTAVAELLQAPVATSVSGKGVIDERHALAVGWGYGPHGSEVAQRAFERDPLHPLKSGVTTLLAVGVKFSEVSTGFYGNPRPAHVVHADINPANLGKVMPADVCVPADAGMFLSKLLACGDRLRRPADGHLIARIAREKAEQDRELTGVAANACGLDPLALIGALRRQLPTSAAVFTDVTASEHLAAEYLRVACPRSFFNPVDNQSMGWSLPAALGAQRACPARLVVTLMGDGCFLMSMQELATAAREGLAVKVFLLDDHAYHYMQMLQDAAYRRTTATKLARLDYRALATGFGVGYHEITAADNVDAAVQCVIAMPGPVLVRVATDYGTRKIRWIDAVRKRYAKDLSAAQKARFAARIAGRTFTSGASD